MRLRSVLFFAMIFVSTVPVLILAVWQQNKSLEQEINSVKEKHLLVAGNLTAALDRYVNDAKSAFETVANQMQTSDVGSDFNAMLKEMGFRFICHLNNQTTYQCARCVLRCPPSTELSAHFFASLSAARSNPQTAPDPVIISNLRKNLDGLPSFYLLKLNNDQSVTIGELDTEYPKQLQKAILFGRGGHAAIVDKSGQIIAHPLPKWVEEMKDISALPIVKKMMSGESGVTQFFSPAAKAEMVAGFNVVSASGWGVMVPQPFQELVEKSNALRLAVYGIAALGILIATAISWWLSGVLAKPLQKIAATAIRVADGDMTLRAETSTKFALRETSELTQAFNHMLERTHTTNRDLIDASDKALAASRVKSEFLANMSHELRTPLNAIIGFSDMIRNQRLGPVDNLSYLQYAKDIQGSGQHLLELINDILDISIVEQGKMALNKENVAINDLVKECSKSVSQAILGNGVTVSVDIPDDVPEIYADQRALKQITLNLLGNSAKFTPENGQITVSVRSINGQHILKFIDTGIGIPAEKLPTIVDPFVSSEINPYQSQQGAGLGLAIVKSLVDLHDGNLDVASVVGEGTTVTVTLPSGAR